MAVPKEMKNRERLIRFLLIMLLATGIGSRAGAQTSYLSKIISVNLSSVSTDEALATIGKLGGFRFSYDADLIRGDKKVSIKATNTHVDRLLKEMLGREITNKEVGNHVILLKNTRREDQKGNRIDEFRITGTVYDATTRNLLDDVTIYEVEKKESALTAKNGTFFMIVPGGKKVRGLCFVKMGYIDTVIFVRPSANQKLDILLKPEQYNLSRIESLPVEVKVTAIDSVGLVTLLVPRETMVNSKNLQVHTTRPFQISFIPYLGTNWKVGGSITNRVSLNLLAGYSGGLKGVEVGGLLNIDRNDIRGVQVGGLGNIVGGKGKGWQIGGLFNYDLKKFEGVQIGGLMNYVPDTISGVQIGGLVNTVMGKIKGVQIAGLTNVVTSNSDGWQVAGLLNVTVKDVKQVQIAGLLNYGHNIDGVQIGGLINIARNHNDGVQIGGLLNYATIVNGLQLGLINISNTVERGIPIGLFSYVQDGYHLFEISGNEIFYGNVAFKSGTRRFYNIFNIGMGSDYKLNFSYGIGTIFPLSKKLSMNIDAFAGFVYHPTDTVYHGLLLKLNPALEYRFARHFAIFLGPAYNCFVFSKGKPSATSRGLSFYDFYFHSTENASIQMWIGGVLGVRL